MASARRAVVAALAAVAPVLAAAAEDLRDVPLGAIEEGLVSNAMVLRTPRGIEFDVAEPVHLVLPLAGARALALDVVTDAPLLLTWAAESGGRARLLGPPWRYLPLAPGASTLVLDLREAAGWSHGSRPLLLFEGSGHVVLTGLRARPPAPSEELARAEADRVALWASEPVTPRTINFVTPPRWSASDSTHLSDVLAAASAAVFLAALGAVRLVRRRWSPGVALAAAGLSLVGAHGLHAAIRFLPAWNLSFEADPEARIRDHYQVHPQLGPLAALARARIDARERVGVVGNPRDPFGPQALCFNLAPRPCAIVSAGEPAHRGISGVGVLGPDELDVLVVYDAEPVVPAHFTPVAAVSRRALVARRR